MESVDEWIVKENMDAMNCAYRVLCISLSVLEFVIIDIAVGQILRGKLAITSM